MIHILQHQKPLLSSKMNRIAVSGTSCSWKLCTESVESGRYSPWWLSYCFCWRNHRWYLDQTNLRHHPPDRASLGLPLDPFLSLQNFYRQNLRMRKVQPMAGTRYHTSWTMKRHIILCPSLVKLCIKQELVGAFRSYSGSVVYLKCRQSGFVI